VQLLGADQIGDAIDRLIEAAAPQRIHVGWATVDLDRAERDLRGATSAPATPDLDEPLLGARARLIGGAGPGSAGDATDIVLLEPSTEGPLAAALARHGEGPLVMYLVGPTEALELVRAGGFLLSRSASGPLGPERLVLVGPRDGPFLLIVTP